MNLKNYFDWNRCFELMGPEGVCLGGGGGGGAEDIDTLPKLISSFRFP